MYALRDVVGWLLLKTRKWERWLKRLTVGRLGDLLSRRKLVLTWLLVRHYPLVQLVLVQLGLWMRHLFSYMVRYSYPKIQTGCLLLAGC